MGPFLLPLPLPQLSTLHPLQLSTLHPLQLLSNNLQLLMLKPSLAKSRLKLEPQFLSTNPILSTMSTTTQYILSMVDPTILSTRSTMPLPTLLSTMLSTTLSTMLHLSTMLSTLELPTLTSILVTDTMLSTMPQPTMHLSTMLSTMDTMLSTMLPLTTLAHMVMEMNIAQSMDKLNLSL